MLEGRKLNFRLVVQVTLYGRMCAVEWHSSKRGNRHDRMKLSTSARLRFTRFYVWLTLLYWVETLTIRKLWLAAFETWAIRRILRISWTMHIINEKVLRLADTKRSLCETVKQRKFSFRHTIRHDSFQLNLIEGMIEGKCCIGDQECNGVTTI